MHTDDNDADAGSDDPGVGLAVAPAKPKVAKPPQYKVLLLNDDYTPMEFVVTVLQKFFRLDREAAMRVMLKVHTSGSAVAGVYTAEIAETKVMQVTDFAREHQHPLLCRLQKA